MTVTMARGRAACVSIIASPFLFVSTAHPLKYSTDSWRAARHHLASEALLPPSLLPYAVVEVARSEECSEGLEAIEERLQSGALPMATVLHLLEACVMPALERSVQAAAEAYSCRHTVEQSKGGCGVHPHHGVQ